MEQLFQRQSRLESARDFFGFLWQRAKVLLVAIIATRVVRSILPTLGLIAGQKIIALVIILSSHKYIANGHIQVVHRVYLWLAVELLIAILMTCSSILQFWLDKEVDRRFVEDMDIRLVESASRMDLITQESPKFQDALARARQRINPQSRLLAQLLSPLQEGLTCVSMIVGITYYFKWPAIFIAISVVPMLVGQRKFNKLSMELQHKQTERSRESIYIRSIATDPVSVKEVLLFQTSKYLIRKLRDNYDQSHAEERSLTYKRGIWEMILGVTGNAVYFICYFYAVTSAMAGEITVANLTFVLGAFIRLQGSLSSLIRGWGTVTLQCDFMSDLFSLLIYCDGQPRSLANTHFGQLVDGPRVVFRNVSFKYPDDERWCLKDVSFQIHANEVIGLVGTNGSGKTTLAKLLCGLYVPTKGEIFIDGIKVSSENRELIASKVSGIFEDHVRYNMTIQENIGLGDINNIQSTSALLESARLTGADSVINRYPRGLKQMLGRRFKESVALSAGEWQKVALARLNFRGADLMVLDEPTSSLDAKSEAMSLQKFREACKGKSCLIISHRLPSIRWANRILVMDGGEIKEQGSHDELMLRAGLYAGLFQLQIPEYG